MAATCYVLTTVLISVLTTVLISVLMSVRTGVLSFHKALEILRQKKAIAHS